MKRLEDLAQIVHEAFYVASTGRPGPVLVDITKDVLQAQGHYQPVTSIHLPGYKVFTEGHTGQIRRAAQLIQGSRAAPGLFRRRYHRRRCLERSARICRAHRHPRRHHPDGPGRASAEHPNFISMPGMHGSYAANMALANADLLIALGVRFDDRVTGRLAAFAPHAKVIHVDIDPAEIGKNRAPDVPIVGDVKRVLGKLNKLLAEPAPANEKLSAARRAWWKQVRDWKAEHPFDRVKSETEIKPQHLMAEIDRLSNGDAIVTSDVGQHQMWAAQLIRFNEPRLWVNSGGLGSMGFGLPAAIGAQFARPEKLVFSICGDGGFQMSIPEFGTIASNGLPIKIIIMNNGYLGMVRQWQTLFYNNRLSSVELDCFPDAAQLAGAYGFKGRTIDKPSELAPALEEAVREPGPYLLNVKVSQSENVYPMVPAGAAINEMVLGPPEPVAVPGK